MIISEQWLRSEWVNPDLTTEELAHQLTMAGLEVDAIEPAAKPFSGVIVAEILKAEQHPDADKLRVCEVSIGEGTVQIVCGAPNARAGLKAPLAQVGAVLPGDFKIKKAKLRGVESQGMLCAQAELGISDENAGLMELAADAPVGMDLREYLSLDDNAIEIGLTPNRADCLGIKGIARDVAVLNGLELANKPVEAVPATIDDTFPITLSAPEGCPRYLGRVIRNVDMSKGTPLYMSERLRRAGIRSIDPAVDVTNYVMLELGQPMHAFDLDTLSGGIDVRESREGETLTLLDGSEQKLTPGSLLITDSVRPLALAGIMGGEDTGVSENTKHLFLECAFFAPLPIAGRARSYGLHTDASHRYERGVDYLLQAEAMERATQLLLEIVGGEAGPVNEVVDNTALPNAVTIQLRPDRIRRVLGFDMDGTQVEQILTGLGFAVASNAEGWSCTAPSWRFDMEQEVDLIEELARVYGYNNLPVSHINADLVMKPSTESRRNLMAIKRSLTARGFFEAITYSFVAPEDQKVFNPDLDPVALRNPISSELAVMRTSLIPGLLNVLSHNAKRQQPRVRAFETGLRFIPGDQLTQTPTIALAMTGGRQPENWANDSAKVDFFDMKGEVEQLLAGAGDVSFRPASRPGLHPGQTAEVLVGELVVGVVATVHPNEADRLDLSSATFVAELDQKAVLAASVPACDEISKYPEVRRDIAILADRTTPASEVEAVVRAAAGACLNNLIVFDVYQGERIDSSRKSLALGLTFRDQSRTLSDEEISESVAQVIDSLKEKLNVELRG